MKRGSAEDIDNLLKNVIKFVGDYNQNHDEIKLILNDVDRFGIVEILTFHSKYHVIFTGMAHQINVCDIIPLKIINLCSKYNEINFEICKKCICILVNIMAVPLKYIEHLLIGCNNNMICCYFQSIFYLSSSDIIKSNAMIGLGNIGGHGVKYRDLVLNTNILNDIIYVIKNAEKQQLLLFQGISWSLSNLCRWELTHISLNAQKNILLALQMIMMKFNHDDDDNKILENVYCSFAYLTYTNFNNNLSQIQYIMDNIVPSLICKLKNRSSSISIFNFILSVIDNIIHGGRYQHILPIINMGIIPILNKIINDNNYIELKYKTSSILDLIKHRVFQQYEYYTSLNDWNLDIECKDYPNCSIKNEKVCLLRHPFIMIDENKPFIQFGKQMECKNGTNCLNIPCWYNHTKNTLIIIQNEININLDEEIDKLLIYMTFNKSIKSHEFIQCDIKLNKLIQQNKYKKWCNRHNP